MGTAASNSASAGFLPLSLARVCPRLLSGLNIYLRHGSHAGREDSYALYCAAETGFTPLHYQRLADSGVKFIFIPMSDHSRFRRYMEERLADLAADATVAISVRTEMVYESCVKLVDELLSNPDLKTQSPRLERISRAVTTLTLNDPTSFSHLLAASRHDFYTATHMVNVATWMVPLAYALGHRDSQELNTICQAGLLHDIGKTYIPAEILNAKGKLTPEQWDQIRRHPQFGAEHLDQYEGIHPLIRRVTLEHHERMDGSGYPMKLGGEQIDPISRICAVVDSYDAMTARRPFKEQSLSAGDAIAELVADAPRKYDAKVVDAWRELIASTRSQPVIPSAKERAANRRLYARFAIDCPARLHILDSGSTSWSERLGLQTIAHNISRGGLGLLSQKDVPGGQPVRVYLQGNGSLQRTCEGMVMRCRPYRDAWYEMGIQCSTSQSEEPRIPLAKAA